MTLNKKSGVMVFCLVMFIISGCSVFMAANQPDEKDVSLFRAGTPRNLLLAEFGMPAASETRDGKLYDVFQFVQGYSTGVKAGRAVFHGVADVLTIGVWEVVGTPTEAVFDGDKMAYEVRYDEEDRIDQFYLIKGQDSSNKSTELTARDYEQQAR